MLSLRMNTVSTLVFNLLAHQYFSEFGYATYTDFQEKEHKFFWHDHLGIVHSYGHPIYVKGEIKKLWKLIGRT